MLASPFGQKTWAVWATLTRSHRGGPEPVSALLQRPEGRVRRVGQGIQPCSSRRGRSPTVQMSSRRRSPGKGGQRLRQIRTTGTRAMDPKHRDTTFRTRTGCRCGLGAHSRTACVHGQRPGCRAAHQLLLAGRLARPASSAHQPHPPVEAERGVIARTWVATQTGCRAATGAGLPRE